MIANQKIAVVVPAYRVAGQIGSVIAAVPRTIDRIFVVDDASPDDLASRVKSAGDPRVMLLTHERNLGVGGAMITGFQEAIKEGYDIVVKCDGDGQMDPEQIPRLLASLLEGKADHVKGTRFHHFKALRTMPTWRFIGNVGLTFLAKFASGYWNILDPVNGFLATRATTLGRLPLTDLARDYFFETDLLIRLNIIEARVAEIPFPARYGEEQSSLSLPRALLDFPPRLMLGLVRRFFWRYLFFDVSPVAVFSLLGSGCFFFGLVFGAYHWIKNARLGIVTPTGTVMLAVLPFILGFQLLLQAVVLDIQNTPRPDDHQRTP